ncbi:exonuclease III [Pochonia chlamydosporia 170]|uniref:Exonuclease III n=1 Tax=Pochonia chlamydosporia 170 TaxID=1380566 RepID=A0A179EZS6_METCM|nr:exonuclease III [Pochonia chlamydosporia 170]OAQ58681.1 exonuclease III [Pochonia chlamydosporia 170]
MAAAVALGTNPGAASTVPSLSGYTGSLAFVPDEPDFTFKYTTNKPSNGYNWIGIWKTDGPDDGHYHSKHINYKYAPGTEGSVTIDLYGQPPGTYKAYFLAYDGYELITDPIEFSITPGTGSLAYAPDKLRYTFDYTSNHENRGYNWIGIWGAEGGPSNGNKNSGAIAWKYAPGRKGSLQFDFSRLQHGTYKAYFLAFDGYGWIADPIEFTVLAFLIEGFTTQNARQGDLFEAKIGGLLVGPDNSLTKLAIDSATPGWVSLSEDGTLRGTPNTSGIAKFNVIAASTDGTKHRLAVTIPVMASGTPLVDNLKVLSFNIWLSGQKVNDYHRKQINAIASSGADIVGMQECYEDTAPRLAKALGWYEWHDDYRNFGEKVRHFFLGINGWNGNQYYDVCILSRYPIVERLYDRTFYAAACGVRIALDGDDSQVTMFNAHLGYDPYGPEDFCKKGKTKDEVTQREADSQRTPEIHEVVDKIKPQIANYREIPVILTGDFNAPSHLDWTSATANQHCGVGAYNWPTSIYPTQAGLMCYEPTRARAGKAE